MDISARQFGLFIAYLLPGFIGLFGLTPLVPEVLVWLQPVTSGLGASLLAIIGAMTLGMTLSCFRWLLIDTVHHRTGIVPPDWDDTRLDQSLDAFNYLVENHYRYYQFYANTLIAVLWTYSLHRFMRTSPLLGFGTDSGVLILCAVLFAGSRDALAKYYLRTGRLIGQVAEKDSDVMTNGNHVEESAGSTKIPNINPANPKKTHVDGKHQSSKPKPNQTKE
jgi:hypothetical protein